MTKVKKFKKTKFPEKRTGSYRRVPTQALRDYGAPEVGLDKVEATGDKPRRGTGKYSVDRATERALRYGWRR